MKLLIYFGLGYFLYQKFYKPKAMKGCSYGEVHDPFEHPMGEQVCNVCQHHHPELEKRLRAIERDHQQY